MRRALSTTWTRPIDTASSPSQQSACQLAAGMSAVNTALPSAPWLGSAVATRASLIAALALSLLIPLGQSAFAAVAPSGQRPSGEVPRNRDAETIRDTRIECARMGESAQAVAQQWKNATDAQVGASRPVPRSVRCAENAGATDHPSGAEPMENAIDQASDRRWRERGLKRTSRSQRPHVSIEDVESVEQDLRWAQRAMDRGEDDRAFRILSRIVDRAARVPVGEAAQAFDILASIGDAHMAAGHQDRAATVYRELVTLGTHLDDDAAATADSLLRSAAD